MSPAPTGSRARMIEAVRVLALSKGFPATTVDEVCAQAAVTKGAFYHHFSSKDDIGRAALAAYFDELVSALTNGPYRTVDDPVEKLMGFVSHTADVCAGPIVRNGCLLGTFALDLAETHPDIQRDLAERFGSLAGVVTQLIAEAAAASGATLASERLAQNLLVVIEGSIVLAKAHNDPGLITAQIGLFGEHLDLLLQAGTAPTAKDRR